MLQFHLIGELEGSSTSGGSSGDADVRAPTHVPQSGDATAPSTCDPPRLVQPLGDYERPSTVIGLISDVARLGVASRQNLIRLLIMFGAVVGVLLTALVIVVGVHPFPRGVGIISAAAALGTVTVRRVRGRAGRP